MTRLAPFSTTLIAAALLGPWAVLADVVYLKDGGSLEGVVSEENGKIVVRSGSIKMVLEKDRILRIEAKKPPREEYQERLAKVPARDARAHYNLGLWCLDKRLPSEARDCFVRVLVLDPNHQEAHRNLGHTQRDGQWVKLCAKCAGSGKADCPTCKGTGIIRKPCPLCVNGKKACDTCRGLGFLPCPNCGGAGAFVCDVCGGIGGHWEQEWVWLNGAFVPQPTWIACPMCGGQGRLDCPNCIQGRVDCKQCKGGRYKCPSCDGLGYKRAPCAKCEGIKKVNCPICNGKGYVGADTPSSAPQAGEASPAPP